MNKFEIKFYADMIHEAKETIKLHQQIIETNNKWIKDWSEKLSVLKAQDSMEEPATKEREENALDQRYEDARTPYEKTHIEMTGGKVDD